MKRWKNKDFWVSVITLFLAVLSGVFPDLEIDEQQIIGASLNLNFPVLIMVFINLTRLIQKSWHKANWRAVWTSKNILTQFVIVFVGIFVSFNFLPIEWIEWLFATLQGANLTFHIVDDKKIIEKQMEKQIPIA